MTALVSVLNSVSISNTNTVLKRTGQSTRSFFYGQIPKMLLELHQLDYFSRYKTKMKG